MKTAVTLLFVALMVIPTMGQEKPVRDRYRMATSYLGVEGAWSNAFAGVPGVHSSSTFGSGRINIGGIHFWSRADFYISFPVYSGALRTGQDIWYSDGIITGGRYMPFGLRRNRPMPFLGIQWMTPKFRIGSGPTERADRFGVDGGLTTLVGKRTTIELGFRFAFNQSQQYYLSPDVSVELTAPQWGIFLGVKRYVDFTAGMSSEPAKAWVKSAFELLEKEKALSGISLQAGISASTPLRSMQLPAGAVAIPGNPAAVHPDIGIGYYFHKSKVSLNLSLRSLQFKGDAFDYSFSHRQTHLHAEGFKVLFDYKGFSAFAGIFAGITAHRLRLNLEESTSDSDFAFSGGVIFGWDIRPTDVDWYYLRTNLRYLPASSVSGRIGSVSSPQLEVNFIQFVFFPQRYKLLKS